MKVSTLEVLLEEILEESSRIKKIKNKLTRINNIDKKSELLGELNAYIVHLKTHCSELDSKLNKIDSWDKLEK